MFRYVLRAGAYVHIVISVCVYCVWMYLCEFVLCSVLLDMHVLFV